MRGAITIFMTAAMAVSIPATAQVDANLILGGILDLPRQAETAPIDGCARVQKGLKMDGGFLLIACEKLLPYHPVEQQEVAANAYVEDILKLGWTVDSSGEESRKMKFTRRDDLGCRSRLSMMVWKDRSMNEPRRADMTRNDYRQIVFVTEFDGEGKCDHHYDTVKAIAEGRG